MKEKLLHILKIIITGILFTLPWFLAEAQGLSVVFEQDPLFSEINILPGDSVTRWVQVNNNGTEAEKAAAEAINYPGFPNPGDVPADDLSRVLLLVISKDGGEDVYGGGLGGKTLFDFYQDGEVYLSDVASGNSQKYDFEISFPEDKSDDWQGKTTFFDILVGFQGQEGIEALSGGEASTASLMGGGAGLPAGLSISAESQTFGDEEPYSIAITWSTNYFSTSRVVYAPEGGSHTFDLDALNYGYGFSYEGDDSGLEKVTSHSVTLTGLTPGVTYYYRCVSHGSLAISFEKSFETSCCEEEDNPPVGGDLNGAEEGNRSAEVAPAERPSGESEKILATSVKSPAREALEQIMGIAGNKETFSGSKAWQSGTFPNLPAYVGNIFQGQLSCLPAWIILVLLIFSLWEYQRSEERGQKRIWLVWSLIVSSLCICFYLGACPCFYPQLFLFLIAVTIFFRWMTAANKDEK